MKKKSKDKKKNNPDMEKTTDIQEELDNKTPESMTEESTEANSSDEKSNATETPGQTDPDDKIKELNEKYLRLSAEFDNYRKRTLKEKIELSKSAGEDLLLKLLPVMDDFERARNSIDMAKDNEAVKEGIGLIYTKFSDILRQRGVKEIEAIEKDFDTDLHEALTKIPAPEKKLKGKVIEVVEKGYLLHDKVIRFAKVVIGE